MEAVGEDIFRFRDTCNVYVLKDGERAVVVDFGRGRVLDHLAEIGVRHVDAVLVTHFHRDQVQGLARAVGEGIDVFVPPLERELVHNATHFWQTKQFDNDYDLRQNCFCLLDSVPVTGWVKEYAWNSYANQRILAVPTPGHTVGSVSYFVQRPNELVAFTGDLIYGHGQLWSLAATQWSYSGVEGLVATMSSCHELGRHDTRRLLPSHGDPIDNPASALALVQRRLQVLVDNWVDKPWSVTDWYREPWETITPHLLRNRSSLATGYALVSDSGHALFIDYGYDICGGVLAPSDRAARRPLLTSLRQLRERFGVERVDVAIPTHYHDDHVAGFNLLHETWGTEIWAEPSIARVLETPWHYNLPCLWHDPIKVQRRIGCGEPVTWREYELTLYPLPGHTRYACAIAFEVDGLRVVATGDQQNGGWDGEGGRELLNYQYRNGFEVDDFVKSAELYKDLAPDLMVSGHWEPKKVTPEYLDLLLDKGRHLADVHRQLLPLQTLDFGTDGFGAHIEPYRSEVPTGTTVTLHVTLKNPFRYEASARASIVVPDGWTVDRKEIGLEMPPLAQVPTEFRVTVGSQPVRRARVAVELCVDECEFGQQAEALITVL